MKDDQDLVATVIAGGPQDFAPIVERYQDAVFGVALARLRNFHDAEDVAQSVFVDAFTRLDRLKEPTKLGAWLRTMAIHKSIDWLRKRKKHLDLMSIENDASHGDVHESLRGSELREQVLVAIGKLGQAQRETITLFYINGYSVEEVAQMQDAPVGTVKARLHDARKKLKGEMMKTVEGVLKSGAPKEQFGARVFELLNCYGKRSDWSKAVFEIKRIGNAAVSGFVQALGTPHWQTRRFAGQMLSVTGLQGDQVIALLKERLNDTNKKARQHALWLLELDVADERKRKEFLPLLIQLLKDRSALVRRRAAHDLQGWATDVPLSLVAEAVVDEKNKQTRLALERLLRAVLKAGKAVIDGGR